MNYPMSNRKEVKTLLGPDAQATLLQREKPNSPTRLLAATYAYKILNRFGSGTTQRGLQENLSGEGQTVGHMYYGSQIFRRGRSQTKIFRRRRRSLNIQEGHRQPVKATSIFGILQVTTHHLEDKDIC